MTIERLSSIVEIAIMLGLSPCFTEPKIAVGKVSTPAPFTKLVMMKSSRLTMNASKKPEMIPGIIKGNRIRVNALAFEAYKSIAACSKVTSIPCMRACIGR